MSGAVGAVAERTDRPALVRFKRVVIEDKAASLAEGRFVGKDVDYALITPNYSKDCLEIKVTQWKVNMEADVRAERMPKDWQDTYLRMYQAWLNGQELPLNGAPIRGWGVLSPAQQENLIRMNILTVEDLAGVNDEGMRRLGMGGLDLKNKATAWLQQLKDKGPLTQEVAALKNENAQLLNIVEQLQETVKALEARIPAAQPVAAPVQIGISADDIMPEDEQTTRPTRKK
jgi:hypothetical protein